MIAALEPALAPFSGSYDPDDVHFLMKPVALAPTDVAAKERLIQSGARHYSEMVPQRERPGRGLSRALPRRARPQRRPPRPRHHRPRRRAGRKAAANRHRLAGPRRHADRRAARAARFGGLASPRRIIRSASSATAASTARRSATSPRATIRATSSSSTAGPARAPSPASCGRSLAGALALPRGRRRSRPARPTSPPPSEDYLIPSGILNAIVSGLVSRSILNDALVGPGDFHACVHHRHLAPHDLSRAFVDAIDALGAGRAAAPARPHRGRAGGSGAGLRGLDGAADARP